MSKTRIEMFSPPKEKKEGLMSKLDSEHITGIVIALIIGIFLSILTVNVRGCTEKEAEYNSKNYEQRLKAEAACITQSGKDPLACREVQ